MGSATIEIYRTESGSVYEVVDGRVRRAAGHSPAAVETWEQYAAINRIPAAALAPGATGEVLEILLQSGRRIYTSRLVPPG